MMYTALRAVPFGLGVATLTAAAAMSSPVPSPATLHVAVPTELPARALPVVREHTYRMAGRIRVLLIWVGRDDVGSGVIKWRASEREHGYELLIGTEPQRAPGALNKWGYLAEQSRDGESSVVGLISQDNEEQLDDVKARLKQGAERRAFDTIRGRAVAGEAFARVGTLYAPSTLTATSADVVLEEMLGDQTLGLKRIERAHDVRGGFLTTLNEMIAATLRSTTSAQRLRYVHGDRLYDLRLLETTRLNRFERDGKTYEKVIRSRFQTGEAGGRSGTRFELVYGTEGALSGVPILISYQPKWWLHVDLVLQT